MKTRKIFWAVLMAMCAMTASVKGQNESPAQKYERLERAADAAPTDWQKQFDAAQMLIDKESEVHDQVKAGKFYERIYHLVADVKTAVPDSVFYESCYILMLNAMNQQDLPAVVSYADEITHYAHLKGDKQNSFAFAVTAIAAPLMIMLERPAGGVDKLLELRKVMADQNIAGEENTDVMLAMLYDMTFSDYREWIGDRLLEIVIEGKPYVLIAMGRWNVEQPFMGWAADEPGAKTVFVDENMKVYDDLHGNLQCNFNWDAQTRSIVKSPDTTTRLITVTPERRQQMVEVYKKYLKK